MGRGIADLFVAMNALLPTEVVVGIGVVLGVVAVPLWIESIRQKQIRGMVRRMVRADDEQRTRLRLELFALANGRARRLIGIAQQAAKYDQRRLKDEAIAALQAMDAGKIEIQRLIDAERKAPIRVADPLQAVIRVEGLLDEGLPVAAREHLDAALGAFPGDPDLLALSERVAAAESEAAGAGEGEGAEEEGAAPEKADPKSAQPKRADAAAT